MNIKSQSLSICPLLLPALAVALLPVVLNASQSMSMGQQANASGRLALVPPSSTPPAQLNTPGVIFCEQFDSALMGYTFDYDPQTGVFALRRPLFSTTLSDQTGSPETFRGGFRMVLNSDEVSTSTNAFAGLDATLGLTHIGASFSQSNEARHAVLGTTFRLTAEADFPRANVDLLHLPQSAFDPAGWNILQMPGGTPASDLARTNAWFQAGFGKFVAVGYDLRGKVDVVFTMNQTTDYREFDQRFGVTAQYTNVSTTFNIVEGIRHALETSDFSFTFETQGGPAPHLPSLQELTSINGQVAFANELNDHAANCKRRVGLYLVSAFALPNGPSVDVPTWDDAVLSTANNEVHLALRALFSVSRWNFSPRIAEFLRRQMRSTPNQNQSLDAALQGARDQVAQSLAGLRTALKAYGDPDRTDDPATIDAVLSAASAVHVAAANVAAIDLEIQLRVASLPPMVFTITDGMTPTTGANPSLVQTWMHIEATNVGVFSPITIPELEALLAFGTPYTETLYLDEYFGSTYGTHAASNGGIPTVDVLQFTPIATGDGAGLYNLSFDILVSNLYSNATNVRLRLIDDINRVGVANYDMSN